MLQPLITRPRAIFAILMAIGAASLTLVAIERTGDPQAVLTEVEHQINAIDAILKRHTYVVKNANSPKPADRSRALLNCLVQTANNFSWKARPIRIPLKLSESFTASIRPEARSTYPLTQHGAKYKQSGQTSPGAIDRSPKLELYCSSTRSPGALQTKPGHLISW